MKSFPLSALALLPVSLGPLSAATYTKGYTQGNSSPLLVGNGGGGETLFLDQASTGGVDQRADGGNPGWGWEITATGSWLVGDRVEFTGVAIPFAAVFPDSMATNNTQNGEHTITFYSAGAGSDSEEWEGTDNGEQIIGSATVTFASANEGAAVYVANFDSPVVWSAADSTTFYLRLQSTGAMRFKAGASNAEAALETRATGVDTSVGGSATTRLSVAGTVTPLIPPPTALEWFPGGSGDNVSLYQEGNWLDSDTGLEAGPGAVDPDEDLDRTLIIRTGIPGGGSGAGGELQLGTGALVVSGAILRMNATSGIDMGATNRTLTITNGKVLTETLTNGEVLMQGTSELELYGDDPLSNTTIDLQSSDCFVFFPNRKPSTILDNDLDKFKVDGVPVTDGSNLSVSQYYNGAVVQAISLGLVPMKAFSGAGLTGTQWDFTTGFKGSVGLGVTIIGDDPRTASLVEEYTIDGWGEVGGTSDAFHFVYRTLDGDGSIVAQVDSVDNGDPLAKAGIMIREDATHDSPNVLVFQRPDDQVDVQWRSTAGGATSNAGLVTTSSSSNWLRLERVGNSFTASYSTVSATGPWTSLGSSQTVVMGTEVLVGLVATSNLGIERNKSKLGEVAILEGGVALETPPGDLGLGLFEETKEIDTVWERDNQISSFLLKRGYMATVAADPGGQGLSKFYAATEGDLLVDLPIGLAGEVSFMRILPWRWLARRGWAGTDLSMVSGINAGWNYEWEPTGFSGPDRMFLPMIKGDLQNKEFRWEEVRVRWGQTTFLGYNEPEAVSQGNLTVDEAIALWPKAQQLGLRLGSPARTDGINGVNWHREFMTKAEAKGYRVDFICVHNYNRRTGAQLQTWLEDEYDYYNPPGTPEEEIRPIWLTEFQRETDDAPSPAVHQTYLEQSVPILEAMPEVEGYAYYNFETVDQMNDNASLFDSNGVPNSLGQVYGGQNSNPGYTGPGDAWAEVLLTLPTELRQGTGGSIAASFSLDSSTIATVEFFAEGVSVGTDASAPYELPLDSLSPGRQTVYAVVTTSFGEQVVSSSSQIEVIAATPRVVFLALSPSPAGTVTWTTVPGKTYRLSWTDDLDNPAWTEIETRVASGTTDSATDPNYGTASLRFYRVFKLD